jgi:type II secretion system protein G
MIKINKKGFTLIELLVVIAIIGLLSTLAVVSLNNARAKSRDAKRVADIKQVQTALELYYTENSNYPNCIGGVGACTVDGNELGVDITKITDNATINGAATSVTYMGTVPADPSDLANGSECDNAVVGALAAACNARYVIVDDNNYYIVFYLEGTAGSLDSGRNCANEGGVSSVGTALCT